MLARAALARRALLRRCSASRVAPAASTIDWCKPAQPPAGTLEKLADAVRFTALKAAPLAAALVASHANVALASSPEAVEGLSNAAMTGLAIGAAVVGGIARGKHQASHGTSSTAAQSRNRSCSKALISVSKCATPCGAIVALTSNKQEVKNRVHYGVRGPASPPIARLRMPGP